MDDVWRKVGTPAVLAASTITRVPMTLVSHHPVAVSVPMTQIGRHVNDRIVAGGGFQALNRVGDLCFDQRARVASDGLDVAAPAMH